MQKHHRNIQEKSPKSECFGTGRIRKRLPKEEMVETSLKGLVRINQMEKCIHKGKLHTKNKYIHDRVIYLGNNSLAIVKVSDRGIPRNAREVGRE